MKISLQSIIETLGDLAVSLQGPSPEKLPDSVTADSRKASQNTIFTAINGSLADGHDFIDSAIASGAKIVVCEKMPEKIPEERLFIRVTDSYSAYAKLTELYAGFPAEKLILTGITGTNGKTTTAYILHSIITSSQNRCGLISTVEYSTGISRLPAERTTPDAIQLQKMFKEMNEAGCHYAVMEVSSHALDQNRTGSAKFAVAIFTNISGDHLDYHHDMDSYFQAKKILFEEHIADDGYALINTDDPFGKKLHALLKNRDHIFSFGTGADTSFRITDINMTIEKTEFSISLPDGKKMMLSSPLCGKFNIFNTAASVAAAYLLNIDIKDIREGVRTLRAAPGRMERCSEKPLVFVDYAHTDDALANILSTVTELLCDRKLTVVFGCGGDRDRTKRPRMGAVAAKYADKIVVTSDNPRSEDPDAIIAEITEGIPEGCSVETITDRGEAIKSAIMTATPDTVVVIAGKGHENYQEIDAKKIPFDDRQCVSEAVSQWGVLS